MSEISNVPISSEQYKAYRNDFAKSANLFHQALDEYNKTTEYHKKEQLKKTMKEAMTIMNQIVKVALKKNEQAKEKKIVKDYNTYVKNENVQNFKKLTDDLDDLQKSLG